MGLNEVMTFIKDVLQGMGLYSWIITALILGIGMGVVKTVLGAVRK